MPKLFYLLLILFLAFYGADLFLLLVDAYLKLLGLLLDGLAKFLDLLTFGQFKQLIAWCRNRLKLALPKTKVPKTYAARVLVQHLLTPEPHDYSSFSEVVLLGKMTVPAATDFSTAFFDDNQDLIDQVAQHLKPHLETSYPNANGQLLTTKLVKICQLADVLDQVTFQREVLEISNRLYTFTRKISLEEFLDLYEVGLEVDDD